MPPLRSRSTAKPPGGRWPTHSLCLWLDSPAAPESSPPLDGVDGCDLAVVGAGLTGVWTALLAKERDPGCEVVVLEADRIGGQASGRNGGFCMATLTHGYGNGLARFPGEIDRLEQLGADNLDEVERAVDRYAIDCDWRRTGEIDVACEPWMVDDLAAVGDEMAAGGRDVEWLDGEAMQKEIASPRHLAGLWKKDRCAMVDPARLVWGLARAARDAGVRIHEGTPVERLERKGAAVVLRTPSGALHARRVMLATNAFPALVGSARRRIVPVYDYALMTEPLSDAQWAAVGWRRYQGLADGGNRFHYYRVTDDGRILWGGYDAIYHFGNAIAPELERRPATFEKLSEQFLATFPQLHGVHFTHAWAGVIDSCTRFCPFWGTAFDGRAAYALGYTGAGVGPARFGALVALELLDGGGDDLTRLRLTTTRPVPWPPEPLRAAAIGLTSWSMGRADEREGARNLWLRALDRLGLGFDT